MEQMEVDMDNKDNEEVKEKKKRGRPKKAVAKKVDEVERVEAEQVAEGGAKREGYGKNGNLRSLGDLTTEEQRAIASAGGKASVEKRRKRKAIRDFLNDFLDADASPILKANMQKLGVPDEDMSNYAALCISLFAKAANHADINAFRTLMEYAGRAPLQEMRENEAIARMSQVMQLAEKNDEDDNSEVEDVIFYIPDNGRTVIKDEDLVTVE